MVCDGSTTLDATCTQTCDMAPLALEGSTASSTATAPLAFLPWPAAAAFGQSKDRHR
jgi:hypothetical protein